MKSKPENMKVLFCILFIFISLFSVAQHTLTVPNAPVAGDIWSSIEIDTTGINPGSAGSNQTWNFPNIMIQSSINTSTFVPITGVANASLFPSATIGMVGGASPNYTTMLDFSSSYTFLGLAFSTASNCWVWGNPLSYYTLPFTYGTTFTDTYSYVGAMSTTNNGTNTAFGDGTGTLYLQGSVYTNVLRVKRITHLTQVGPGGSSVTDGTYYDFYSPISKFPLLSISTSTAGTSYSKSASINAAIALGLKKADEDANFSIFPNPVVEGIVSIRINSIADITEMMMYSSVGEAIKTISKNDLEQSGQINVSSLEKGVYFVHIKRKNSDFIKKLVIQ